MLKGRIIPILNFNGFALVKTKKFGTPRMVGNPVQAARVFNSRNVDELAFIDITASKSNRKINLDLVKKVINQCFMPVSIGGNITTLEDIRDLLNIGADKVVLKTSALTNPNFIEQASKYFGNQCITVSVDLEQIEGRYYLHTKDGIKKTNIEEYLTEVQDKGAGEIILSSVNNDGMMDGYNLDMYQKYKHKINVPLIANSGASKPEDFSTLAMNCDINSFGAASVFFFTQFTPIDIKNNLKSNGIPVRL